ncbi:MULTISPECIES: AbrB/MazE/SpoVT family DNA-binding domain-containing protein [Bacillus cereus group]|uniref:AbrB/MazE/SpoVT family DNA-binding domain-containing protein n=1 Tax=Bacillus cereus group TaxID=86661 RepID=UPI0018CD4A03|nr:MULTISPECIES: AbrB/MazE/SpoVT family DNA-binding domain-containing protein [Bacillus cereus group]MBG9841774.1 transcriptional regulator [Bacillus tropicus]MBG9879072.1 transcriptional regulator [Bacillus tropicus]MBG9923195.1 transcriptional regulator [Bacillus tropicus]MBJ8356167.1 transcriptional regulator [Bacillus mycoides]MED2903811.1 AbrB/MazE/SpoVT family DNA-binding domain-containing protein [Bacillus tropicus]
MESSQYLGKIIAIEEDGSVRIPIDMFEGIGVKPGDKIEVFADFSFVYLRKTDTFCELCKKNAHLHKLGTLNVCSDCLTNLQQQAAQVSQQ